MKTPTLALHHHTEPAYLSDHQAPTLSATPPRFDSSAWLRLLTLLVTCLLASCEADRDYHSIEKAALTQSSGNEVVGMWASKYRHWRDTMLLRPDGTGVFRRKLYSKIEEPELRWRHDGGGRWSGTVYWKQWNPMPFTLRMAGGKALFDLNYPFGGGSSHQVFVSAADEQAVEDYLNKR